MNNELKSELVVLIADANNFIMTLSLKGDEVVQGAALIKRCGEAFRKLNPEPEPEIIVEDV